MPAQRSSRAGERATKTAKSAVEPPPTTTDPIPVKRVRIRRPAPPTRFRVVFAGPVGAGKTTAVRALSDVDTVDTDVAISAGSRESGDGNKTTTTVGLDYGLWKPTTEISVSLVGTPGQERFATSVSTMMMPSTRVLLWLRADRDEMLDDADEWLTKFGENLHRVVIAVTRTNGEDPTEARKRLRPVLERHGLPAGNVHAADPRDRDSVMRVVSTALDLPEDAL